MKLAKKLKEKIEYHFDVEIIDNPVIKRTYAGTHQRTLGAWSWYMNMKNNKLIGSCDSAKSILKSKYLQSRDHFGDFEVIGLDEKPIPKKDFGYTFVKREI